jgi:hypothetical protein
MYVYVMTAFSTKTFPRRVSYVHACRYVYMHVSPLCMYADMHRYIHHSYIHTYIHTYIQVSMDNYFEMSSKTASSLFLLKKKVIII